MSTPVFNRILFALLLAAAACPLAGGADASRLTPDRPAEYMVYQYPDTVLVIRTDIPEAGFGVRVLGPERTLIRSSGVQGRRLGPVYQYVDTSDQPRQLMIEVTPARTVDRDAVGLELIQFSAGERNSAALARAFRLYSIGTETAHSDDTATWATKIYSLRNAAGLFAELGREELRLWSEYFAAHLVLHELEDSLMAIELSGEIQRSAARAGFAVIGLAANVLEGEALLRQLGVGITRRDSGDEPDPRLFVRAHATLLEVADGAGALGLQSEQARALYQDGLVFERQGETRRALDQYERALDIMTDARDPDLQNELRATAAAAYEALGSASGALEMLDDIAAEAGVAADAAPAQDLAGRLYERGRLLNVNYRYDEAIGELSRALELQRNDVAAGPWGPTGLELAWAYYSLGRNAEAIELIQSSLPRTPLQEYAAVLARAYGSLANMYRAQGRFEQAARARETQGSLLGNDRGGRGQSGVLFEMAMDARQRHGEASREARELLQWSRQAAAAEGDDPTAARSVLQLCLLELTRNPAAACRTQAEQAYERLQQSGVPRFAAEAGLARARILERAGETAQARQVLERTLTEVAWYRRVLPGVLGAWYPAQAPELARAYLKLASAGNADRSAARLLLALDRLRAFDVPGAAGRSVLAPEQEESLRNLLARRESVGGAEGRRVAGEVMRGIEQARLSCAGCGTAAGDALGEEGLRDLLAGLGADEAVLTYYLGEEGAWAVLADRAGTRRYELAQAARVRDGLGVLRERLAEGGPAVAQPELESLGRLLLGPLPSDWPRRIYLLPAGPLRAVPFDALRLQGAPLGRDTAVVNLASLEAMARRRPALGGGYRDRVFLAGSPASQRDPFRFELNTSAEIRAVTDRFVGPGLHVVQGVALARDEFADSRFSAAALLHLAMPGVIDLSAPPRSRLLLSGGADATVPRAASLLTPADIQGFRLAARLVALTATAAADSGELAYAGQLPLVSDFLDAGASAVLYTLWLPGEDAAAAFADAFYGRLESDPDIVESFVATRKAVFEPEQPTNLAGWSGFQLLIR